MPKYKKTRKQKIRASMRQQTVQTTVLQASQNAIASSQQIIKVPGKFSLQNRLTQNNVSIVNPHTYLKGELLKTAILSLGIILCELILFFLLRNHLVILPGLPY